MDGWMNGRTDGWTDKRADGRSVNQSVGLSIDRSIYRLLEFPIIYRRTGFPYDRCPLKIVIVI